MSFQNVSEEVLAFCYDGPITLALAERVVGKHIKNQAEQNIHLEAKSLVVSLVSQGWIELSEAQNTLVITERGYKIAEEILVKNNMSEYLKF